MGQAVPVEPDAASAGDGGDDGGDAGAASAVAVAAAPASAAASGTGAGRKTAAGKPGTGRRRAPTRGDAAGDARSPGRSLKATEGSAAPSAGSSPNGGGETDGLRYLSMDALSPNPHQPREHFGEVSLQRLAASIKADGVMQPIVGRPAPAPLPSTGTTSTQTSPPFELVAGERRWRAARLAGLERIPAIVRELDDRQLAEWALVENIQREDLNPLERAEAFHGLVERFGLSHDDVAGRVGLDRSSVSNLLRLLRLDGDVQALVRDGRLSMGQARAIAGLESVEAQRQIAQRALREAMSVRKVEQLVKRWAEADAAGVAAPAGGRGASGARNRGGGGAYLADLEQQIAEQLQTRVRIRTGRRKGSGSLTIEFYSLDEFDGLLEKLGVQTQ
ncbi:MAG: ParB/RepB/Spo0J family partition protein [Phycisphaeraceae bacterium]